MKRTINQKPYNFSEDDIAIEKLHFWPENPRIYADIYSIYASSGEVDSNDLQLQEKIYQEFKKRDNVRELRKQIETADGLAESLIVRKSARDGYYDVLEGNRRLAACKMNYEKSGGKKFTEISCEIIPSNMSEGDVLSLLGTLHIHGKNEWSPFAKASFIRRKINEYISGGMDIEQATNRLKDEMGLSIKDIYKGMKTVDLMEYADEEETNKYSYYEVLLMNRDTKKIINREAHRKEERRETKVLIDAIKDWDGEAIEFRKAIASVFKDNKVVKKFLAGKVDLADATEKAHDTGSTDKIVNRVKKFRDAIKNDEKSILSIDPTDPVFKLIKFEFDKLYPLVTKIRDELSKKGDNHG